MPYPRVTSPFITGKAEGAVETDTQISDILVFI